MKRTPYYHLHRALGAVFEDRIGFQAAVVFTETRAEHTAVRERVGLFDVYYQVAVEIRGSNAQALLGQALVNDVRRLEDGAALYSSLLNEAGGIVDDLTCFRFSATHFWLCPTPSRVTAVLEALQPAAAQFINAVVTNLGYKYAYISVQGPKSRELLASLTNLELATARLPYFHFTRGTLADVPDTIVSRTGYSGELGYELFYPIEYAEHMWSCLARAGERFDLQPCGLRALRSLRAEKKYLLYGLDIDTSTDPLSAGLGWTVRFDDRKFAGRSALERIRAQGGPQREMHLLDCGAFQPVTRGDAVLFNGSTVGSVTSSEPAYTLNRTLAFAYLQRGAVPAGSAVEVQFKSDGVVRSLSAQVLSAAPYDPGRKRLTV